MAFRACLRYIYSLRRLDHVSHLEISVMGTFLTDNARIQLLSFLYKVFLYMYGIRAFFFSLFRFASSARLHRKYLAARCGKRCLMADYFSLTAL
jgi:uncharacterized membrane protein